MMEDQEILKTRIFRSYTILSLPHPQQSPASSICPTSIQGGYVQIMEDQEILKTRILKSIPPFPSHFISLSSLYPRRACHQITDDQKIRKTSLDLGKENLTTKKIENSIFKLKQV